MDDHLIQANFEPRSVRPWGSTSYFYLGESWDKSNNPTNLESQLGIGQTWSNHWNRFRWWIQLGRRLYRHCSRWADQCKRIPAQVKVRSLYLTRLSPVYPHYILIIPAFLDACTSHPPNHIFTSMHIYLHSFNIFHAIQTFNWSQSRLGRRHPWWPGHSQRMLVKEEGVRNHGRIFNGNIMGI